MYRLGKSPCWAPMREPSDMMCLCNRHAHHSLINAQLCLMFPIQLINYELMSFYYLAKLVIMEWRGGHHAADVRQPDQWL